VTRVTRRVPLIERELLPFWRIYVQLHIFPWVRVSRFLVYCVAHCGPLSLCPFSFGNYSVCPSIYGFWFPLWYCQSCHIYIYYMQNVGFVKSRIFKSDKMYKWFRLLLQTPPVLMELLFFFLLLLFYFISLCLFDCFCFLFR
jgi:hypothetical protein